MKLPLITIGIVLIAAGLLFLAYQGITYTSRGTVLGLGGRELAGGVTLLVGAWRVR